MMRYTVCVAFLVAVQSLVAAPLVKARISRDDVREICRVVRGVTREPVRDITSDSSTYYVPGSIMEYSLTSSSRGNGRVKRYIRSDRVLVTAGREGELTGPTYDIQKIQGRWKIVGKGHWIR